MVLIVWELLTLFNFLDGVSMEHVMKCPFDHDADHIDTEAQRSR